MLNSLALGTITLASSALLPVSEDEGKSVLIMKDGRIYTQFGLEQQEGHVDVALEAGTIQVPDELVELVIKEEGKITFEPQTEEEIEKFAEGYVPYDGRWLKIKNAERAIRKEIKLRLAEAEEDLSHQEWRSKYVTETKHFQWLHTTPMRVTQRFVDSADAYYEAFKSDWKIKRDKKKKKLAINFYNNHGEYMQVSGAPPGAAAYFMNIPPYDLNAYYDRLDAVYTEQVVFHELGHYLHKLIDEQFSYPHWPGESLCEYYGGARFNEETGKLEVGLIHNGRLAAIRGDIDRGEKIELEKMITTRGFEDYTWGWAFVRMLMEDKKRGKNFRKFFLGLAKEKGLQRTRDGLGRKTLRGPAVLEYFMTCMKIKDKDELRELEQEWYDYIDELEFDGERALLWEAKTAARLDDTKKARELYKKAFSEAPDTMNAGDHYAYWRLLRRDGRGDSKEGITQLRAAIEKAPLSALFRYELGTILSERKGKNQEEGALLIALAKELNPDVDRNAFRVRAR